MQCGFGDGDPHSILHHVVREPLSDAKATPTLILLHGYGSDEKDLFPIAHYLPKHYRVICARAPVDLGGGRYAWYAIDMYSRPIAHDEAEAILAQKKLVKFIKAIQKKYNLPKNKIRLAGFSQGGIMCMQVGLNHPALVDGVAVLAGRILNNVERKFKPSRDLEKLNIWIAHGTKDFVIGVDQARRAYNFLKSHGLKVRYEEYENAGHEIHQEMLLDFIRWLENSNGLQ